MLGAFSSCTCGQLAGPDEQLREAAKGWEQLRELPGTPLKIARLQVSRITPEPELEPPQVVFNYDLEGALSPGTRLSALGVEKVNVERTSKGWAPQASPLPRLAAVLAALGAVRPQAKAWYLRVDLDKAEATAVDADQKRTSYTLKGLSDGGYSAAP